VVSSLKLPRGSIGSVAACSDKSLIQLWKLKSISYSSECSAYDRIWEKLESTLFTPFGGCGQAAMKHDAAACEPSFQVAKFVYACMEFRRSDECEDYNPYFDLSLLGDEWQRRIHDTSSSGPEGDIRVSHFLLLDLVQVYLPMYICSQSWSLGWLRSGPF
jgi:hypothetical protein